MLLDVRWSPTLIRVAPHEETQDVFEVDFAKVESAEAILGHQTRIQAISGFSRADVPNNSGIARFRSGHFPHSAETYLEAIGRTRAGPASPARARQLLLALYGADGDVGSRPGAGGAHVGLHNRRGPAGVDCGLDVARNRSRGGHGQPDAAVAR